MSHSGSHDSAACRPSGALCSSLLLSKEQTGVTSEGGKLEERKEKKTEDKGRAGARENIADVQKGRQECHRETKKSRDRGTSGERNAYS